MPSSASGLSPKAYLTGRRYTVVKQILLTGLTVLAVIVVDKYFGISDSIMAYTKKAS
jgi:hypothetical protein